MHLIIYTSEYTGDLGKVDSVLQSVVTSAQKNNRKRDITGVLFYHNGRFVQALEGQNKNLRELLSLLKGDTRHKNLEILVDQSITTRFFPQWSMDSFNLSENYTLTSEELKTLSSIYRRNFEGKSSSIIKFFKAMVKKNEKKQRL